MYLMKDFSQGGQHGYNTNNRKSCKKGRMRSSGIHIDFFKNKGSVSLAAEAVEKDMEKTLEALR